MSGLRWRPAAFLLLVAGLALLGIWTLWDAIRQMRVMASVSVLLVTGLALLLWWAFWSGLPGRARLSGVGLLFVAIAAFAALFRIRGVSGDLVPIFEPRWRPARTLATTGSAPSAGAVVEQLRAAPEAQPAPIASPAASDRPARGARAPTTAPAVSVDSSVSKQPSSTTAAAGRVSRDYPQFLGPDRDGVVRGIALARDWSARKPRLLWRQPIGVGWSAFAVSGEHAVTQEQRGEDEAVVDYELRTGRVRWIHADKARYATTIAGEGPRATPTIASGRVFTVGSTGILNALDLETGRVLWTHRFVEENGGRVPEWGKSGSPLLVDGLVVVSAGGSNGRSLVAYGATTGERRWAAGDDGSAYASPVVVELAGRRQILIFNSSSVAGHDPAAGTLLWEHRWPAEQPNVAQPLPLSADRVLFSAGYGIGSKVFEVSPAGGGLSARLAWESPRLKAKFTNLVLHRGFVYGLDDGVLVCLDPAKGERRWKAGRYGHGQVLLVDDLLLVQTEEGEIVLVDPNPESLEELTRFQALDGKTWNPPALAAPYLLVRNDREAALYELPLAR